ncbi:MAG: T9SS type A sorting domain-containing protein [Bacteroidales bacterium]
MVLSIWQQATAFAGADDTICSGDAYVLTGATAAKYGSLTWYSAGGTFNNSHALNPTFTPTTTGSITITLTATGLGSCSDVISSMLLKVNPTPTLTANSIVNTTCNAAVGSVLLTSSDASTITLNSIIQASGTTFTGLTAAYYTATTNGECPATTSFNIINTNSTLVATVSFVDIYCYGGSTTATITTTGGTGTKTYLLNGTISNTTGIFSNLAAGVYNVLVTDANGCTYSLSFDVDQPIPLALSLTSQTNVLCYGASTGSVIVLASGGTTGYTYSVISGPNVPTVTGNEINGMNAGIYTIQVSDAHSCLSTLPIEITQPALALDITSTLAVLTNPSCNGTTTGSINTTVTGGTIPYSYAWSNGTNAADPNSLSAGTYTVTVTDANGCTSGDSYTLTEPSAVTLTASSIVNTICNASVGSVKLTSSDTSSITLIATTQASGTTFTGLSAGYYIATTTGACPVTNGFNIFNTNSTLVANVNASEIKCYGGTTTATVTASGGSGTYDYLMNGSISNTTGIFNNLGVGSYNVLVSDGNGCSYHVAFYIDQPTLLIADFISTTDVSCYGGSNGKAVVNATGGTTPYSYSWNTLPIQTTTTSTGLSAGTYTVTVADAHNCTTTASVIITEPSVLTATASTVSNVLCYGASTGSVTATVSGGTANYNYTWNTTPPQTSATATGLPVGTYTVTVTDHNGCTASSNTSVTQPVGTLTANAGTDAVICGNDSVSYQLSGTAANSTSVHWTTSGTGSFSNADILNPVYTPSAADILDVQIQLTLTASCNSTCLPVTDYMVLTINPVPVITNCFISDTICEGSSTQIGTLNLNNCGGCTYTYNWTSNPIGFTSNVLNPVVSPLVTTIYTLEITNPLTLCSISRKDTVVVNPTEQMYQPGNQVLCNQSTTAAVNFIAVNLPGIITYSWTNNQPGIGLSATGSGDIASFTAINTGTTPIVATIVVTPTYTYGGVSCNGTAKTFTITVNPTPTVFTVSGSTITCPVSIVTVSLSGSQFGTDYEYTLYRDNIPVTGSTQSGTGSSLAWSVSDSSCNISHTYKVHARILSTLCETDMSGTVEINFIDTIAPTFTRPADITLYKAQNCEVNDLPTGLAGDVNNEADNCSTGLQATYTDVKTINCEGSYTISRTWSLTDHCGNSATGQVQTITVLDTIAPTFTKPSDITLYKSQNCEVNDLPTGDAGDVSNEADNCSTGLQATYTDVKTINCEGSYTISRTWSLTDHCGNSATGQVQTITVLDTIAPTFTKPSDITLYKSQNCEVNDLPTGDAGDVSNEADNCSTGLQATYTDVKTINCEGSYTISRTWSLTDHCGNSATGQVQTITVLDTIAPTFTKPSDITLYKSQNCEVNDLPTGDAGDVSNEADNCSTGLQATYTDVKTINCEGSYTISRTWSLTDHCGNSATGQVQTITVLDTIAPTFTKPSDITLYKSQNCEVNDLPTGGAGDVSNEADNCSTGLQATYTDVKTINCEGSYTISRTWSLTDHCGNSAAAQIQIITVLDTIAPTFTRPSDITIYTDANCGYDVTVANTGNVNNAADNCSTNIIAGYTDVLVNGSCIGSYTISRTWSLVDHCGNQAANQIQTITVLDTIKPGFIVPADITIYTDANCTYNSNPTVTGKPASETDNCTAAVNLVITHTDTIINGACSGAYTIIRLWKVSDCAGNFTTHSQLITVTDSISPVIHTIANQLRCATTSYNTYTAIGSEFDATYSDNCSIANVNYSLSGSTSGNGLTTLAGVVFTSGITNVSLTVSDCANNQTTYNYTITINPGPTPQISGDTAVCCSTPTTYCDIDASTGNYSYQWTISGGVITSIADTNCVSVSWNCNCTSGWLQLTKTNLTTGCVTTTLHYDVTIYQQPTAIIAGNSAVGITNPETYSIADVSGNLYSWSVIGGAVVSGQGTSAVVVNWGSCGNCTTGSITVVTTTPHGCSATSTLNVTINTASGNARLTGQLTYDNANNTPLNGVNIQLIKNGNVVATTTTYNGMSTSGAVIPGYYEFNNIAYGNYSINVSSTKPWGGVTATDALLIKLHSVGLTTLTGLPFVAANVNNASGINATDALLVQLRIVGLVNQFAAGDWKFSNTPFTFSASDSIFSFKGICVGDVNKSYNTTFLKQLSSANDGVQEIQSDKSFIYNIKSNSVGTLGAMTLFMNYDDNLFEIEKVIDVLDGMTYKIENGKIGFAWSDLQSRNINQGETMISLQLRAKRSISHPTQIFSYNVSSEFADPNAVIIDNFGLKMSDVQTVTNSKSFDVINYPNPARDITNIVYTLPEEGKVRITITNILGQSIRTIVDEQQSEGIHKVVISAEELNLYSGVYMYQLEVNGITTNYSKLGKIVFER